MLKQFTDTVTEKQAEISGLLQNIFVFLVVFLGFLLVALIVRKVIKGTMSRISTQGHVDHIVAQLGYAATIVVGLIAALSASRLANITALATSLGLVGFAVGFAVKDVLGNFLSGILILAQRPFTIGDEISVSGVDGRVQNIRVRDTLVKTGDATLVYIPNSIVFNSIVANKSAFEVRQTTCRFTCRNGDSAVVVTECERILKEEREILADPPPQAYIDELTPDGYVFKVTFWTDTRKSSADQAKSHLLRQIADALTTRGFRFFDDKES